MSGAVLPVLAAFAIALIMSGAMARAGILDRPNARSNHARPTPRGGDTPTRGRPMTLDSFLTRKWNVRISLMQGIPTFAFVVFGLATPFGDTLAGMVLLSALGALFFSLAGIPPLVGFFGKYWVFLAAVNAGLIWLAVAGAVASVIGAFYYLRVVKVMVLDEPGQAMTGAMPLAHLAALSASAVIMTFGAAFGLFGVPGMAAAAAAGLF